MGVIVRAARLVASGLRTAMSRYWSVSRAQKNPRRESKLSKRWTVLSATGCRWSSTLPPQCGAMSKHDLCCYWDHFMVDEQCIRSALRRRGDG